MKLNITMIMVLLLLAGLAGCSNNNNNEEAQPRVGVNRAQVNTTGNATNRINTTNTTNTNHLGQTYDNPYHHNYDGEYTGERDVTMENDIRSAQQVASRASAAAEKVSGVDRAISVVQGMDIVVGIDTKNQENLRAIEQKVQRTISRNEQGYNVYVTTDPEISERIQTLFTNMNNVKTSFVTPGISDIIFDIGQANARH
jgi:hypothetical protein